MAVKLQKKNTKVQKVIKKAKPVATPVASARQSAAKVVVTLPNAEYIETVGRRKTATARVRIYKAPGDFVVNNMAAGQYFANITNAPALYNRPFEITDTKGNFAASVIVSGSGVNAQLGAVIHGLSRALSEMNEAYHPLLKQAGLLTRDDRMKETRKIGTGGKARRKRQSPKR
jgi:small subunit ribosomal protein S9